MNKTNGRTAGYVVIGIFLAVTLKFILYFFAGCTTNTFLRWGYFARILEWIWLLLIVLYAAKIEKQKFLLWKEITNYSFHFYIISVLSIGGLVILSGFFTRLLIHFVSKPVQSLLLKGMMDYLHTHVLLLVFTSLTAGVVEELIFRGYLIPRLNKLLNNYYLPVIISALLFGISHFQYGTAENIIFPTFVGLIFGFYYQKYRNLKFLIITHFLIDFFSLILH